MVAMAKKPQTLDHDDGKSKKVNLSLDLRILETIARYQKEQLLKVRFKPTMRDVVELALITFFENEGIKLADNSDVDDD